MVEEYVSTPSGDSKHVDFAADLHLHGDVSTSVRLPLHQEGGGSEVSEGDLPDSVGLHLREFYITLMGSSPPSWLCFLIGDFRGWYHFIKEIFVFKNLVLGSCSTKKN